MTPQDLPSSAELRDAMRSTIERQAAEIARLREALGKAALYYTPPDETGCWAGWSCFLCKGEGDTETTIEHENTCPLHRAALQEPKP